MFSSFFGRAGFADRCERLKSKISITFDEFLPFPLWPTGSLLSRTICNCIHQFLLIQQESYIPMRLRQTRLASLACAILASGQCLAGAVPARLAVYSPCENQAGENAGDLTLAATACEIRD